MGEESLFAALAHRRLAPPGVLRFDLHHHLQPLFVINPAIIITFIGLHLFQLFIHPSPIRQTDDADEREC